MSVQRLAVVAVLAASLGCSSISTVRVQPEAVHVGPQLRPIAVIHAQVTSAYFLWIPIPGHVDLDYIVNRMLLATAKQLGADKVVDIQVDITPDNGIWALRKMLGWRSATATGVAVMIEPDAPAATDAQGAQGASPAPAAQRTGDAAARPGKPAKAAP